MIVRITLKRVLLALSVLGVAGMAFGWSGVMQVSASSGHWAITDWFLHWTMRNSVRTHAALAPPPEMPGDTGLVSAAGHYKQACAICHGAPGVAPSPAMQSATPPAPDLSVTAREWSDRQLFWIIRHGVKYTGMPAWAALDRTDEVGRMTAFIRQLPGMSPARYRALTEDQPTKTFPGVSPQLLANCTGCHGADGMGRGQADIPILAGQSFDYLRQSLRRYASGTRASGVMQVAVAPLTPAEMDALARYFSAMPGLADKAVAHPIVTTGIPARQLPACASCHAPDKPYPVLTGQKPHYLAQRLRNWRGDDALVDARKPPDAMAVIARRLHPEEIDPLAMALSQ